MPLTFDMPMPELVLYQGANPRPDDFDAFWDRGLKKMQRTNPRIERVPAEFQTTFARCEHLYFTGVGGARIHAKLILPENRKRPHPAVLMFHGYGTHSGDWMDKLAYAAEGFVVAAMDCRGQGGRSEDTGGVTGTTYMGHIVRGLAGDPDQILFRRIFLDTAQLAGIVMNMDEVDENELVVTGSSQGGGLTLACAALEPRIKKAAPVYPFLCDYKRVWDLDLDRQAYQELRDFFRNHDPLHEQETEIFTRLGYIDVQHLCPRIHAEVFMGIGLMDEICPPSTQFAAYNKIRSPKSLALYPDFAHEDLPGHPDKIFTFLTDRNRPSI
ncbi:MAG: alpha/beta fold hydrolase [Thermodesulfobacteriota bacterium]